MSARSQIRILLLSIRDQVETRIEEHASFARHAGLEEQQIHVLNVFEKTNVSIADVEGFDALFIGGTSEASVLEPETYPFVASCQQLVRDCIQRRFPVFASCFGFQLTVLALGGKVIRDTQHFEMGSIPVSLSPESKSDPLFKDVPDQSLVISVHQEKARTVPPGCQVLARTQSCVHAIRIDQCPYWAFQFHPEVDRTTLIERLSRFKARYTEDDQQLVRVLASVRETPESNRLVSKFVDRVLLGAS